MTRSSGDGARDRRLLQEARAASALDHPNVAAIHEIGETADGRGFIAMAYCDGESLSARIARGPLPVEEAAGIACQVADALAAAHCCAGGTPVRRLRGSLARGTTR